MEKELQRSLCSPGFGLVCKASSVQAVGEATLMPVEGTVCGEVNSRSIFPCANSPGLGSLTETI